MSDRRPPSATDAFESELRAFAHRAAPHTPPHFLDHVLEQTQAAPQASRWSLFSWPLVAAAAATVVLAVAITFGTALPQRIGVGRSASPTPSSAPTFVFLDASCTAINRDECDELIDVVESAIRDSGNVPTRIEIAPSPVCVGEPDGPMSCPSARDTPTFIASAEVALQGTDERALLKLFRASNGRISYEIEFRAPPVASNPSMPPVRSSAPSATPPLAAKHGDWVRVALPDPSGDVFGGSSAEDVVAFNGGYVAVGAVNASCCADGDLARNRGVVWTSSDGVHWEMQDRLPAFEHSSLHQVINADGRLVVAGTYAAPREGQNGVPVAALWTSTDGTSWERVSGDVPSMITLGPHGVVGIITEPSDATTDPMNWFATSSDGVSWKRDSIGWPGDVHGVAARADGIFVAVGASSEDRPGQAVIWYTSEVGGWIEHTATDAPDAQLASVTVFDGRFFVAVDDPEPQPDGSDRGEVWSTDDPTTGSWTSNASLGRVYLTGIFALDDALVAVGTAATGGLSDAAAWISSDFETWGLVRPEDAFRGINNEVAAVIPARDGGLLAVGWYYDRDAGHLVPAAWLDRSAR